MVTRRNRRLLLMVCGFWWWWSTTLTSTTGGGGGVVFVASMDGAETLIGICGKDFVLLAADAVAYSRGGAFLTSRDLDKIAILSADITVDATTTTATSAKAATTAITTAHTSNEIGSGLSNDVWTTRDQSFVASTATAVAVVGDAADADRLVGLVRSAYNVALYEHCGDWDVTHVDCCSSSSSSSSMDSESAATAASSTSSSSSTRMGDAKMMMNVHSVAQLARYTIATPQRGKKPYTVALLVAGLIAVPNPRIKETNTPTQRHQAETTTTVTSQDDLHPQSRPFSIARHVQHQISQATLALRSPSNDMDAREAKESTLVPPSIQDADTQISRVLRQPVQYKPILYWIDEYGAMQRVSYGVHGVASHTLWSVLDRGYRDDMTLDQALHLLQECLVQLQSRCVFNTHPQFSVKCMDTTGCRVIDLFATKQQQ